MRKLTTFCLAVSLFAASVSASVLAASSTAEAASASWLNADKLNQGVIGVTYENAKQAAAKLIIGKGDVRYTYSLAASGKEEFFPLQLGDGAYTVTLYEQVSGNKYKVVQTQTLELQAKDANAVYLNSVQNVNWGGSEAVVKKAAEVTKNAKNDAEKVQAIYKYIVDTVAYDAELAATSPSGYIPNLDGVLTSAKGICYDYASLFAAMTRSVGVPTKLLMGSSDNIKEYHAWNEAYVGGQWIIVDTTYDATSGDRTLAKDAGAYKAAKVY